MRLGLWPEGVTTVFGCSGAEAGFVSSAEGFGLPVDSGAEPQPAPLKPMTNTDANNKQDLLTMTCMIQRTRREIEVLVS